MGSQGPSTPSPPWTQSEPVLRKQQDTKNPGKNWLISFLLSRGPSEISFARVKSSISDLFFIKRARNLVPPMPSLSLGSWSPSWKSASPSQWRPFKGNQNPTNPQKGSFSWLLQAPVMGFWVPGPTDLGETHLLVQVVQYPSQLVHAARHMSLLWKEKCAKCGWG